ncbi:HAD family phosphatase [Agrococcus sp. HG114]|uniref:HAD family hydrolase n=1 Tax=Agrococcus sp. HG114 TaxID=2969757 RepID=UPI00215A255B|nr:HAD family phosphatase [Agrococcus sp. HG114]MCR8669705.1 HAD family phosphatase [Agrococcus sp. HG114]
MTPPASRPIGAVLFDLDGTLVDTEPAWMAAEARLAADHGIEWTAADAEALVGVDLWDGAAHFIARGVPMEPDAVVERLVGEVLDWMDDALPARPGALELLAALRDDAVPVALVTMSTRAIVDRVEGALARALGGSPFTATVAGDECERGKPHPEPYLRGLELLGVDAADAIAIEDSRTGAASALAAGLTTIGVPHAVDVSTVPGVVHWPSLSGRTPADLAEEIRRARA